MSALARRLAPYVSGTLTHPRTRAARRWLTEQRRRLAGAPHCVHWFHQADDPYSHLGAQVLARLRDRYDVVLEPHLVGPPSDDAAPERARLETFARKDAADVAPFYGLAFPAGAAAPDPEAVALAARLLASAIASGSFAERAATVGDALWRGGRGALEAVAAELPPASREATRAATAAGDARRRRLGHYLGGMFHYAGEWSWGVDRLDLLEERLAALGLRRAGAPREPIVARPQLPATAPATGPRLRLEFFPSLRSPYTAIAMRRVLALPERLPVELVLRPVLPMVMRGLPVPRAKQLYILLDTKREAERVGEPFGFVCDPVGRPVERAFALYPWARDQGRAAELLHAFTRAAFAEGIDTGSDAGLRGVVERAGLDWTQARPHLDDAGWREELEANREALLASGLWGVPSFRLLGGDEPPFCTWGQDRIWRVEAEIHRRLAREGSSPRADAPTPATRAAEETR